MKSLGRSKVLGGVDQAPLMTGFAAYRATVDVEQMKAYPDTAELLARPGLNLWLVIWDDAQALLESFSICSTSLMHH